jgi:hypothetical protein
MDYWAWLVALGHIDMISFRHWSLLGIWAVTSILFIGNAGAATLVTATLGTTVVATAVDGLVVNGVTYNVTFGTTQDLTFLGDLTDATTATQIIDGLLIPAEEVQYSNPSTLGPTNSDFVIPTALTPACSTTSCTSGYSGEEGNRTNNSGPPWTWADEFVGIQTGAVYAEFARVSATPLPAALPLFATGLGGLGLLGWRRKRKNATAIVA